MQDYGETGKPPEIKLKPLLGLAPPVYLTILFFSVPVLLLFALFVLPGLVNNGVFVQFACIPDRALLIVEPEDGSSGSAVITRSTPCKVFIRSGKWKYKVALEYHASIQGELDLKGPLFGSLFFPKSISVFTSLPCRKPEAYLEYLKTSTLDVWINENSNTPFSSDLSFGFRSLGRSEYSLIHQDMSTFLDNLKGFVSSKAEWREWLASFVLLETQEGVLSQRDLVGVVLKMIQLKEDYPESPFYLNQLFNNTLFPLQERDSFRSPWLNSLARKFYSKTTRLPESPVARATQRKAVTFKKMLFPFVPECDFSAGNPRFSPYSKEFITDPPRLQRIPGFYVSETEITNRMFKDFVQNNPLWSLKNLSALMDDEMATPFYLIHWNGETPSEEILDEPVTYISHYSAQAFCQWFSDELSKAGFKLHARLMYEEEWELLSEGKVTEGSVFQLNGLQKAGTSDTNSFGVRDIWGNVWEWCEDWYSPSRFMFYKGMGTAPASTERVVRGGSWGSSEIAARGAQPPAWCTPYLGFRIVLTEMDNG